jgi:hypothetical protein
MHYSLNMNIWLVICLAACSADPGGNTSRHAVLMEMHQAEVAEITQLKALMEKSVKQGEQVPLGTPFEIAKAQAKVTELQARYDKSLADIRLPLITAESELREARTAEATFHDRIPLYAGRKRCGDNGCSGSCGTCDTDDVCHKLWCRCIPECTGQTCGSDGCGGTCGDCTGGQICTREGTCKTTDVATSCTPECRSLPGDQTRVRQLDTDYPARINQRQIETRFSDISALRAYVLSVSTRHRQFEGELTGLQGLRNDVVRLEAAIAQRNVDIDIQKVEEKRLKKEARDTQRAAKQAEEVDRDGMAAKIAGLERSAAQAAAKRQELASDNTLIKASAREIKGRIKNAERNGAKIATAARRLEAQLKILREYETTWAAAVDKLRSAEANIETAKMMVAPMIKKVQEATLSTELTAAKAELIRLQQSCLATAEEPDNDGSGVLVFTGAAARLIEPNDVQAVQRLIEAAEEAIERRETPEEDEVNEELIRATAGERRSLFRAKLVLEMFQSATARLIDLRRAIVAERERLGG